MFRHQREPNQIAPIEYGAGQQAELRWLKTMMTKNLSCQQLR